MRLVKLVSLAYMSISFLCATDNISFLSSLKQEKLDIDRQKIELESKNLKYNWIKQITGSYSTSTIDGRYSGDTNSDTLSVMFDQPVFKSGGIYYAIQYAGANREFLRLNATSNEQNIIKSVISSWLDIKKYDLQINRQGYLIKNAKIDIIRKQEQYESGFLDSSFLDQAILAKTTFEKILIDMEALRYSQLMTFKSLSDSNYMDITPPTFVMIDQNTYINNSIVLKRQNAQSKRAEYLKKMTITNYFLTFSVYANYQDVANDINLDDTYNQMGLRVSVPLIDVNRGRTIEIQQLEHLKSKIEVQDIEVEESNLYRDSIKKIELLNKKIDIVTDDAKLYDSLLVSTKELFEAGEKTVHDVDTLYNSKQTMILDREIYKIDAQKVFLNLYAKMYGEI
ncbi:MAG: TolC family protein [Sulfurospirillum sp.]|nr:TolC family protein [Sulfurospirillum sp.]